MFERFLKSPCVPPPSTALSLLLNMLKVSWSSEMLNAAKSLIRKGEKRSTFAASLVRVLKAKKLCNAAGTPRVSAIVKK